MKFFPACDFKAIVKYNKNYRQIGKKEEVTKDALSCHRGQASMDEEQTDEFSYADAEKMTGKKRDGAKEQKTIKIATDLFKGASADL